MYFIKAIFRGRNAGFFLIVSNTTDNENDAVNKKDGYLCFHEINTNPDSVQSNMTFSCVVHGRYVILYNERRSDVTYPDYYITQEANIELCEMEVYGEYFRTLQDVYIPKRQMMCDTIVHKIAITRVDYKHLHFALGLSLKE